MNANTMSNTILTYAASKEAGLSVDETSKLRFTQVLDGARAYRWSGGDAIFGLAHMATILSDLRRVEGELSSVGSLIEPLPAERRMERAARVLEGYLQYARLNGPHEFEDSLELPLGVSSFVRRFAQRVVDLLEDHNITALAAINRPSFVYGESDTFVALQTCNAAVGQAASDMQQVLDWLDDQSMATLMSSQFSDPSNIE